MVSPRALLPLFPMFLPSFLCLDQSFYIIHHNIIKIKLSLVMKFFVDFFEVFVGDMCVNLGGAYVSVAEEGLD